jgi:hypothetical protein
VNIVLKHGEVAVIDDADYHLVSSYKWRLNCDGYAVSHEGTVSPKTIFMHRLINGTPEGEITDHIDQDRLNNRRSNLRTASKSLNSFNSKVHSRNRSGYRGVSWHAGKWRAAIVVNGRQESLGRFDDPAEAGRAYERRLAEVLCDEPLARV